MHLIFKLFKWCYHEFHMHQVLISNCKIRAECFKFHPCVLEKLLNTNCNLFFVQFNSLSWMSEAFFAVVGSLTHKRCVDWYLYVLEHIISLCTPAPPQCRTIDLFDLVIEPALWRVVSLDKTGRRNLFIRYLPFLQSCCSAAVLVATVCRRISEKKNQLSALCWFIEITNPYV